MSNPRPGMAGSTRTCPHCKATILESANVCPACRHHLRFDEAAVVAARAAQTQVPLKVEGTVRHPADSGPWEYSVVLSVRNDRGEEVSRQVVGVGAMQPGEERSFVLAVELTPARGKGPAGRTRH
jgi:hypothetical protein